MTPKTWVIAAVAWFLRTSLFSRLCRASFRKPTFIVTTNPGAFLGNQLTVFAHVIACACDTGRQFWGPSFFLYAKYFQGPSRDIYPRFPVRTSVLRAQRLRVFLYYYVFARLVRVLLLKPEPPVADVAVVTDYEGPRSLRSPDLLRHIADKRVVFLEGYFFRTSIASIRTHARKIKDTFRPLRLHEEKASTVVQQARARGQVLVGVHLRQFDTVVDHTPHPLYRFQNAGQMHHVMRQTLACFPGQTVVFLILSNHEIDQGPFAEFTIALGTGHIVEDLHALSLCDYILASTYSTYSRWASFYGDVPLYQMEAPTPTLSLQDFRVQIPGIYDPSDEACAVTV